jgi:hypothetical protein
VYLDAEVAVHHIEADQQGEDQLRLV